VSQATLASSHPPRSTALMSSRAVRAQIVGEGWVLAPQRRNGESNSGGEEKVARRSGRHRPAPVSPNCAQPAQAAERRGAPARASTILGETARPEVASHPIDRLLRTAAEDARVPAPNTAAQRAGHLYIFTSL
jgi:hypothetical protein